MGGKGDEVSGCIPEQEDLRAFLALAIYKSLNFSVSSTHQLRYLLPRR